MATYRVCSKHGVHEGKTCPECKPEPSKRSKKYGGKAIHIPPNMRSK